MFEIIVLHVREAFGFEIFNVLHDRAVRLGVVSQQCSGWQFLIGNPVVQEQFADVRQFTESNQTDHTARTLQGVITTAHVDDRIEHARVIGQLMLPLVEVQQNALSLFKENLQHFGIVGYIFELITFRGSGMANLAIQPFLGCDHGVFLRSFKRFHDGGQLSETGGDGSFFIRCFGHG